MQEGKLKMGHNSLSTVSVSTACCAYIQQGAHVANPFCPLCFYFLILLQVPPSAVKMGRAGRIYSMYHKLTFPFFFLQITTPKREKAMQHFKWWKRKIFKYIMKPELYTSAWLWVHNTPKSTSLYAAHHIHYDDSFQQTWISVLFCASQLGITVIISMCDLGLHEKHTTKKGCVCTWQN